MSSNLIMADSNQPGVLAMGYVSSSEATIYTCPASSAVAVNTSTLCNSSGATRTVSLSVVKSGGTAGGSNRVAVVELEAGESCVIDELVGLMLGPGDYISGTASAATSVSIVLTGAVSS